VRRFSVRAALTPYRLSSWLFTSSLPSLM